MLKFMTKCSIINCFLRFILKITKKKFLKRSVEHSQFTNICSSFSQKQYPDWKQLSIDGACRVHKLFKE